MKFSECRLTGDNQPNALEMGSDTIIQRHRRQKWKYEYPRHIRPRVSTLSTQNTLTHYPVESSRIIERPSEALVCPISTKSSDLLNVNGISKTHLQNVCQNLEQQPKRWQLKGEQWLISLLEKEFQDMDDLCMYS